MTAPTLTKYVYQIRCRNGAIVDNLQILGINQDEAKKKLEQMYLNCVILDVRTAESSRQTNTSYEDVLDIISNSQD